MPNRYPVALNSLRLSSFASQPLERQLGNYPKLFLYSLGRLGRKRRELLQANWILYRIEAGKTRVSFLG